MTPDSLDGRAVPAPVRENDRLSLLDALRGFALAGVLLANLRDYSLYGLLDEEARGSLATAGWDRWLDPLIDGLVGGKAMTLFALLFGVGFALQLQRMGDGGRGRFARRMWVLLGFGLLHAALWWGDILRYYALFGLLLLLCARWRARALVIAGLFVSLLATSLVQPLMQGWSRRFGDGDAIVTQFLAAAGGGDWMALLRANFDYDLYVHGTAWSLVFFTLGRLLLGAGIGSSGWLHAPQAHLPGWRRLLWSSLPAGLFLTVYFLLRDHGIADGPLLDLDGMPERMASRFLRNAAYLLTGLGYLSAFVLAYQHPAWKRRLDLFAPVGRMALTHYLSQTFVGVLLFYGIGAGLGPRYGIPGALFAFAAIFALQLTLSRWWLVRYRFGPFEWAWRSLTYGRRQPWRLALA